MITLNDDTLGIWQIQLTEDSDFLGSLSKAEDEHGHFEFKCRFRYYMDDKIGKKSNDKKSWYTVFHVSGNGTV